MARFQVAAGAQYKAESIAAYKRRIANALDAHQHYLSTGRAPTFRAGPRRAKAEEKVVKLDSKSSSAGNPTPLSPGFHSLTWPLSVGRLVKLELPHRLKPDDVTRLCSVIRSLQDDSPEPRQIPRQTGEDGGQSEAA
jgi:hypothetical protein